jgi:hypothetical protein
MEKEKYEHLLSLATSKDSANSEQMVSRKTSQGDFSMWGKKAVVTSGNGASDWLVGTWSVDGVPRWVPRMHYYNRDDRKIYLVRPDIAAQKMELIVDQEDKDLDPQRAEFIIENIEKWERELLAVAS